MARWRALFTTLCTPDPAAVVTLRPMNLPNILTLSRILLIPVFVLVYFLPTPNNYLWAALLFGLAAATDWMDGYLARKWGQITPFGAFLDPVADKLIVVTALLLLIDSHSSLWLTLPAIVIVGREIVISALREWMAEMNSRGVVAVSWLGRAKTTIQMVAIFLLLANNPNELERPWVLMGYGLLYAAAVLTLISMFNYLRAAWPTLREGITSQGTSEPEDPQDS